MRVLEVIISIVVFLIACAIIAFAFQGLFNWVIPHIWRHAPYMPYWIAFAITTVTCYASGFIQVEVKS